MPSLSLSRGLGSAAVPGVAARPGGGGAKSQTSTCGTSRARSSATMNRPKRPFPPVTSTAAMLLLLRLKKSRDLVAAVELLTGRRRVCVCTLQQLHSGLAALHT